MNSFGSNSEISTDLDYINIYEQFKYHAEHEKSFIITGPGAQTDLLFYCSHMECAHQTSLRKHTHAIHCDFSRL